MSEWRRLNLLFLTTTVLESLAIGHLAAFTPLLLADLGLQPDEVGFWVGLLYAAMMAVAFPLAPFWGALSERYSRRLIIVRSQYLAALAYAIMAFAPDVWWILAARLILGLTFGNVAVIIAVQTLITPRRYVGSAIATINISNPIAASFGPPFGAVLIEAIGLRGLFLFDAVAALVAALLTTFLMPEPPGGDRKASVLGRTRSAMGLVWQRPVLRWNFASWLFGQGARTIVDAYLPLRIAQLSDDPSRAIGLILGVYGVLTAISTWLVGRLVDDTGGIRWFTPSMVLATIATFGVAVAPNLAIVAVLAWTRSFPFAASMTLLYAHLARVLPPEQQTVVMSLTPVPRNVSAFALPLLAAAVAPFGVGAALGVGALAYAGASVGGLLIDRATAAEAGRNGRSPGR